MLFSSWKFILVFLPLVLGVYFGLIGRRLVTAARVWLVLASLYFYAYWDPRYLPLLLASIGVNFALGTRLARMHAEPDAAPRKRLLVAGIAANLLLLGYYKYTDFVLANLGGVLGAGFEPQGIVLPLAISFFTFTQIAYLVDSYRGETAGYDLLGYTLFVSYFPHLIAGPIVHHRDLLPQFASRRALVLSWPNMQRGLALFAIGLFKKVAIADTFAVWADAGFDGSGPLDFFAAWGASLSYTFQLYFDFSGYCDMALGASLLFNLWLPINFASPYQALDIRDFWRRWHVTLGRFLRDYLYIPLGGNRGSDAHTARNLMLTFTLAGLWHGATWMFVLWGALHGAALVVHRTWQRFGTPLPRPAAWLLTFGFVNLAWVVFRAETPDAALRVFGGMLDLASALDQTAAAIPTWGLAWAGWLADPLLRALPAGLVATLPTYAALLFGFALLAGRSSTELSTAPPTLPTVVSGSLLLCAGIYVTLAAKSQVFLYFNF
jgi:alginate O-acetyltransferase complex protein AlgI